MQLQPNFHYSSLNALDPGSGRKIPAIYHDAGVWHGNFTPESPVLRMGMFQAGVVYVLSVVYAAGGSHGSCRRGGAADDGTVHHAAQERSHPARIRGGTWVHVCAARVTEHVASDQEPW